MLKIVVSCGMIDFVSVFLSHRSKIFMLTLARNISTVIPNSSRPTCNPGNLESLK